MTYTIQIDISRIEVDYEVNREISMNQSEDFSQVYIRGLGLAKAAVDLIAFYSGIALSVLLDMYVDASGNVARITVNNPMVRGICTAFSPDVAGRQDFNAVLRIAFDHDTK